MHETNYLKIFLIFGLVTCFGFCGVIEIVPSYEVEYLEPTVDGSDSEWGSIVSKNFMSGTLFYNSHYKAAYTGSELCIYFKIYDGDNDGSQDWVSFGGDGFQYALKRSGGTPSGTEYDPDEFTTPGDPLVPNGWRAEFCIPYGYVGIVVGSGDGIDVWFEVYDDGSRVNEWPTSPDSGRFSSMGNWEHPDWCMTDIDCYATEYCLYGDVVGENRCTALDCESYEEIDDHECVLRFGACYDNSDCGDVFFCDVDHYCSAVMPESDCGYIGGHEWHDLECCEDNDCTDDKFCSDNVCKAVLEGDCGYVSGHAWHDYDCCDDGPCADDEYCDLGSHTCEDVTAGTCGYISGHAWHEYECCDDSPCADDEYCDVHTCEDVTAGTCGYISGHAWYNYECCSDDDCAEGETCDLEIHTCEDIPAGCTVGGAIDCCSNSDCSDDEYCNDNTCLDVPTGDCGYISEHVWYDYDCCDNEDCDDDEYCNVHTCEAVVTGTCGYISGHAWYDYECCDDESCESYEKCSSHACVLQYNACYDDSGCESYEECSSHYCALQENACESDEDCDDGYNCNIGEHQCEEIPPDCTVGGAVQCCSNSDCSDDKYCNDNSCLDVPTGSCGYVSGHAWYDYECCDNEDCEDDELCSSHVCIDETDDCEGIISLTFVYNTITEKVKALVGGLHDCEEKIITIREYNCVGNLACAIESSSQGGNCEFNPPSEAGFYLYSACADLDGDGVMEFDQEGYQVEEDDDDDNGNGGCESDGCTPTEWSDCVCSEGYALGTKSGTCTDNCGTLRTVVTSCNCEDDGPSAEQLDAEEAIADAEEAIEEAEEEGKDVEEAEVKLEQAQEAYDSENYEVAKELALEAYALASEDEGTGESKEWWEENLLLIGAGVLLLVLGLVITYLVINKIHKGYKGEKRMEEEKQPQKEEEEPKPPEPKGPLDPV